MHPKFPTHFLSRPGQYLCASASHSLPAASRHRAGTATRAPTAAARRAWRHSAVWQGAIAMGVGGARRTVGEGETAALILGERGQEGVHQPPACARAETSDSATPWPGPAATHLGGGDAAPMTSSTSCAEAHARNASTTHWLSKRAAIVVHVSGIGCGRRIFQGIPGLGNSRVVTRTVAVLARPWKKLGLRRRALRRSPVPRARTHAHARISTSGT